jgi:hypothetical protein
LPVNLEYFNLGSSSSSSSSSAVSSVTCDLTDASVGARDLILGVLGSGGCAVEDEGVEAVGVVASSSASGGSGTIPDDVEGYQQP